VEYIRSLDQIDEAADILVILDKIDELGAVYLVHEENTRCLGNGLWELKRYHHRFYYIYCLGNRVYILHACYKQKGKAEQKDIAVGMRRMKEIMLSERMRSE
jgi:phage-related protein